MAVKFIEPGGDATFNVADTSSGGFWRGAFNLVSAASDIVHGAHLRSIKYAPNSAADAAMSAIIQDSGARISLYIYLVALPTSASTAMIRIQDSSFSVEVFTVCLTSAGVIQIRDGLNGTLLGGGSTLSTGRWYRISLAYKLTSTTVNDFRLYKDGVIDISLTNVTMTAIGSANPTFGNINGDLTLDWRSSDHYVDDESSLLDTGDVWVVARRPFSNGTTNGFVTQIGSGGSGYGTGHAPQVNERPPTTADGWSIAATGVTTEEYNIETKSQGNIFMDNARIVDYIGWVYAKSLASETGQLIVNGVNNAIALTSTNTVFTAFARSHAYPAGTGTDIGLQTDATATTVSLFECGVILAIIAPPSPGKLFQMFQ